MVSFAIPPSQMISPLNRSIGNQRAGLCLEDRKILFSLEKLMIYVYMSSLHVLLVCFGKPITSKKLGSSDSQSKRDWPLVYDFAAGLIDPRKNSRHFKLDLSEF
jgi:hypothetical protein